MDKYGEHHIHDWTLDEDASSSTTPDGIYEGYENLEQFSLYGRTNVDMSRSDNQNTNEFLPDSDEESDNQSTKSSTVGLLTDFIGEDDEISTTESIEVNPFDGLPYSSMYYELLKTRQSLPIWRAKDDFVLAVDDSPIVLVTGKTGSGKSTQIPQWCVQFARESNFNFGTVVCAQPSPHAAMSLAIQVAREMDLTELGNEVGYKISQTDCTNENTVLRFCTDEILLREMAEDPLLHRYNFVVIDEVQERTISTDILLALFKMIQNSRDDLRIIIISQSYEMPKLEDFFEEVPIVDLHFLEEGASVSTKSLTEEEKREHAESGKLSQIEIKYTPIDKLSLVEEVVSLAVKLHCDQSVEGDILIFLPLVQDIEEACDRLKREIAIISLRAQSGEAVVIPIHNELVQGSQQALYENPIDNTGNKMRKRRIIVSDDLAESCFTTENLHVIIDTGLRHEEVFNCRTRTRTNITKSISLNSAVARSNRCCLGGQVYRLYEEEILKAMEQETTPCIKRMELTSHVLLLKRLLQRLNVSFSQCQFIEPPEPEAYMLALEELDYHGALDENGNLSDLGAVMSEFPLSVPEAKSVIASCGEDCVQEILTIIAMATSPSCWLISREYEQDAVSLRQRLGNKAGDHFTFINVYQEYINHKRSESWCAKNCIKYESMKIAEKKRHELLMIMEELELPISEPINDVGLMESSVKRALLAGFFMQIARDTDGCGNYLIIRDKHVARLDPKSFVATRPEWVLYNEFHLCENSHISTVSGVSAKWIAEIAPQSYLANLPANDSKDFLLRLAARQRKRAIKEQARADADLNLHSQRKVQSNLKSDNVKTKDEDGPSKSSDLQHGNTRSTNENARTAEPEENYHDVDDNDVLTQAARDMAYAYRKASDYVTNMDDGDSQCIMQ